MKPTDLEALRGEAISSPRRESFTHLEFNSGQIVGVGARINQEEAQYFVEVVIPLCPDEKINLSELEERIKFLKVLEKRGYTFTCEDDGSISCEIQLPISEIDSELGRLAESRL